MLEVERVKHDALSTLSSGSTPDSATYNNVCITSDESSEDKIIVFTFQKKGFLKVRESYVVWPNEES